MKSNLKAGRAIPLAIAGVIAVSAAFSMGADTTWSNTGTSWNATTGSWSNGVPGNSNGTHAIFTGNEVTNPIVNTSISAANLVFDTASSTTSSGYNISTASGQTLTLTGYGSTAANYTINAQNTSGTNEISATLALSPGATSPTRIPAFIQASGGTLKVSGAVSGDSIALNLGGAGTIQMTNAANSYSGGTTIGGSSTLVVNVTSLGNIGSNGNLGTGALAIGAAAAPVNGVGALNYTGSGETSNKFTKMGANATIDTTGATGGLILSGDIAQGTTGRLLTLTGSNTGNAISGKISDNGSTRLTKSGSGTWSLSADNNYAGVTTISDGLLLVNGNHTGAGAYTVSGTGTLGGNGSITTLTASATGVTVSSGGKLSPGDSSAHALTMALGAGSLDISAAVSAAATQSMLFDLGSVASSDQIALTSGSLKIGTATSTLGLGFSDFKFTPGAGFGAGAYTLFATTASINGSLLSSDLAGTIAGRSASLSIVNNTTTTGQSLVLTVVPEPASIGLIGVGLVGLLTKRRRRNLAKA